MPSFGSKSAQARAKLAAAVAGVVVLGSGLLLAPRLLSGPSAREGARTVQPGSLVEAPTEPAGAVALEEPGPASDRRPRYPLEGLVVDAASGEPVTSFMMWAQEGARPSDDSGWRADSAWAILGPEGDWALRFLPDGAYTLRFSAEGFQDTVLENVAVPSLVERLEVRLERGTWVHGTLRDASGAPVPGFTVRLEPETSYGSGPAPEPLLTETDAEGGYTFSGVPEGRWRVELAGLDGVVREPPASDIYAVEKSQEVVWDAALPALTSVRLALKWESKRYVFSRVEAALTSSWGGVVASTLHNDVATFERVQPGLHELTVGRPGETPWYRETIDVPASATQVEWTRSVRPPEREKPDIELPKGGRKKGGGKRAGAGDPAMVDEASTVPDAQEQGEVGQAGAPKGKRKRKGG